MLKKKSLYIAIAGCVVYALTISSARANWINIENFESYSDQQSLNGVNGWQNVYYVKSSSWILGDRTGYDFQPQARIDPLDSGNMAFGVARDSAGSGYSRGAYKTLDDNEIAYGDTGTLYLKFMLPLNETSTCNVGVGLSASSTAGWDAFASRVSIRQETANDNSVSMYVTDGDDVYEVVSASSQNLLSDQWYNFWIVSDNQAGTYDVYYSAGDGTPVCVADDFTFHNADSGSSLHSFIVLGNASAYSYAYIDNIYLSDGVNLTVPVPEPGTLALLAVGLIGLLAYAWKKRK